MPLKLALGTVQFGLAYGAFNRSGRIQPDEVCGILDVAHAHGIDTLDTAHAYGESEEVIGACAAGSRFRLVTKIPALDQVDGINQISGYFKASCERLKVARVHGLLLHRGADLLGANGGKFWRALVGLRDAGLVERIGFSAYGVEEARQIINEYPVQIIQLPMNIFDRRHLQGGIIDLCLRQGIEIHARSVFLQGFILSQPQRLTGHLSGWKANLEDFRLRCVEHGVTALEAALGYVLSVPEVSRVVIGIDSQKHLVEIINAATPADFDPAAFGDCICNDIDLIDPSRWPG